MKNITNNKQITENEFNKVVEILKKWNNTIDVKYSHGIYYNECIEIWSLSLTYKEIKELEKINLYIMLCRNTEHEFLINNKKVKLKCIKYNIMK